MIPGQEISDEVTALIERSDYWRRSPASAGGAAGHKEWSYFCVLGDVDLVTTFSIMDRPAEAPSQPARVEEARVTLLARTVDGVWSASIEACPSELNMLRAGSVDIRLGASELKFRNGAYHLNIALREPEITASLELWPQSRPALTRSVPLGSDRAMQWFVVPRLEATGEVRIAERAYSLRRAPAYHDHNWGCFAWGGDFAWEWGIVTSIPPLPWSLIYYRISDRGRHAVVSQGLLLWQGARHCRTFRDRELDVRSRGVLRTGHSVCVPRIMRLARSGSAGDIPGCVEVEARSGADALAVTLELEDCAQIGIPDDRGDGITVISECRARAVLRGHVAGSRVDAECSSIVEFNRGAA
jgi:hypothetical protein